jgi:hypothetical protein
MIAEHVLPSGVTYSAKKSVRRAIDATLMDRSVESALQELWSAIQDSPMALINEATGKAVTFEQFVSIGTNRTVKKIEKLTRRVRKTTKGLAAFVELGGSFEAIKAEIGADHDQPPKNNRGRRVSKAEGKRLQQK